ncbi:transmembrane protein 74-like [Brachionichthys hirsutus]|uniref:transmembrane protein 74-like n=1 Tax=Brachionichthys hirsutus TaxID=412623 RepID=UPI0036049409
MAGLELLHFEHPDPRDASELSINGVSSGAAKARHPGGGERAAARTEARHGAARLEAETSFSKHHGDEDADDDDVQLIETSPRSCRPNKSSSSELSEEGEEEEEEEEEEEGEEEEEDIPELYLLSDDDLCDDPGTSVDYGFIAAVACLVTGVSLVAISYTVPRAVRVDRDGVSARDMERLEREKARIGAHLDRCVIAGLCLLTLGGALLSTLLMISMWKGETMRRKAFAYAKHAATSYGSVSLGAGSGESGSRLSAAEEDVEALS